MTAPLPSPSWSARFPALAFAVAAAILPPLAPYVPRSPILLAVLVGVAGILGWALADRSSIVRRAGSAEIVASAAKSGSGPHETGYPALPAQTVFILLAALWTWAAISVAWAPDLFFGLRGAAKLAGNVILGGVLLGIARRLAPDEQRLVGRALVAGIVVTLALLAIERLFDALISRLVSPHFTLDPNFDQAELIRIYGYFWLKGGITVTVVFVWPAMLALWRGGRPRLAIALWAATTAVTWSLRDDTALAVMVVSAPVAVATWLWGRKTTMVTAALLATAVLLSPVIAGTMARPESFSPMTGIVSQGLLHRLYIWQFVAERIAEHPLRGWGMNASRDIPGASERVYDSARDRDLGYRLPLHPHNLGLQAWLEFGLPGALIVAAVTLAVGMGIARAGFDRPTLALATSQFVALFLVFSVSIGAWQGWWLATVWLGAALTGIVGRVRSPPAG